MSDPSTCPICRPKLEAERVRALARGFFVAPLPPVGQVPCERCGGPQKARPHESRPCLHAGEELHGRERDSRGLDSRRWRWCLHPGQPLGEAVCGCKGCGPSCPGYVADAS